MIPSRVCKRSVSRADTTALLSHKRKSSVVPAVFIAGSRRGYSVPSKRLSSATATATTTRQYDERALISQFISSPHKQNSPHVQTLLTHRLPFTFIPTPLPQGFHSPLNDLYFPSTQVQDSLAVIDACLYNCHDVPRAKVIFDDLRTRARANAIGDAGEKVAELEVGIYNNFLESFLEMASGKAKNPKKREEWIDEGWDLYAVLENEVDGIAPDERTYAIMLMMMTRFASRTNPGTTPLSPTTLLRSLISRSIPFSSVLLSPVFSSPSVKPTETAEAIKTLQTAAVSLGRSDLITKLFEFTVNEGEGSVMEEGKEDALLEGVPEVRMVTKPSPEFMGYRTRKKKTPTLSDDPSQPTSQKEPSASSEGQTPFNLQTLRNGISRLLAARRALPEDASSRQRLLEESAYDDAAARLKHEWDLQHVDAATASKLAQPTLQKWMWTWFAALTERLESDVKKVIETERKSSRNVTDALAPFITLVKPKKLAVITILEIMRLHGSGGVSEGMKTARALVGVGHGVEVEYQADDLKRREKVSRFPYPLTQSKLGEEGEGEGQGEGDRHGLEKLAERRRDFKANGPLRSNEWVPEWTPTVRAKVGSFLVEALMDVAKVTRTTTHPKTGEPYSEEQPAFIHTYEYQRGKKLGVIKLNPVVTERLSQDSLDKTLHPRHLPMLVQPRPWLSHKEGGYLYNKSNVMRIKDSNEQLSYLTKASSEGHLELVFSGLDVLGGTPWQINRDVFKVVLEVWNSGAELGRIPPVSLDLEEPEKPENFDTDQKAKLVYLVKLQDVLNARRNNHSERCSVNYKMEIARAFLGEKFFMPHNIDFRGRAYPIPPHLNHIGDDLSRGLLMFGESKPLGERGLRWLKIHLANLYGYDKASFDEREAYVMERLAEVYDSAENPLNGRRWWTKADDPWQCLAACMELRKALESGDPHAYQSYLPVHQDGTCNGLQHYAALGGDGVGAKQVNLDITDRPSDVYTYVSKMVEAVIEKDAKEGNKVAEMLRGQVSRKVVKQTVMTTVYGVTFVGARAQIERQLKDRGGFGRLECWDASHYLARTTLNCIGNLFTGATRIQNWLSDSARLIAKSLPRSRVEHAHGTVKDGSGPRRLLIRKEQMTSVIWTTPIGLPIVQPYRKLKRKQVTTGLQSVYLANPNIPSEVNPAKQSSAFPPNFIHSLDATHMMLTALECRRASLTFASVHDSYWSHASSVDKMSEIIRETFIHLHSSDVLLRLRNEFLERYRDHVVPISALTDKLIARINAETNLQLPRKSRSKKAAPASPAVDESAEEDMDAEEEAQTEAAFNEPQKFVNLVDILPKLPEKGEFSVQTIKNSLYFFS